MEGRSDKKEYPNNRIHSLMRRGYKVSEEKYYSER